MLHECVLLESIPFRYGTNKRVDEIWTKARTLSLWFHRSLAGLRLVERCLQLLSAQKLNRSWSIFKIMKPTSAHTTKKISLRVVASAVCTHVSISDYKNRCPVIFELKTTQKPLPGVFLENQKVPVKWLGFAHFLSTFSSVQKEKMTFWPCFWAIFCTPPCPLKNRFFWCFEEKVCQALTKSLNALIELECF